MTTETSETSTVDRAALAGRLEDELRRVKTSEDAERIFAELERLAAGTTEQEQATVAERDGVPASARVERAAETASGPRREVAAVLNATAQQTAVPTKAGEAAVEAARDVLKPGREPASVAPDAARGASLLKQAVLRRLGPLQALDANIFLAINQSPHPRWSDRLADRVTVWANGGWIWAAPVGVARLFGVERAGRAVLVLLPCLAGTAWIVEHPIKAFFRRRRPFIDVVRALVVGKKPGSWSFPSGHTASSFAAAWTLSTIWPRGAPVFVALAACVGFSRIYVGAHYPGDVTSGALFGMTIAELLRQALKRFVFRQSRLWP